MILLGERSRHSRPSSLLSVYGAKIIKIIFIKIIILRLFFLKKNRLLCKDYSFRQRCRSRPSEIVEFRNLVWNFSEEFRLGCCTAVL